MNTPQTISQLLQQDKRYEMAFWATYSVDIETLIFLLKMDLKERLEPCNLHLLCDHSKLDEAVTKNQSKSTISNLQYLQSYCTISPQVEKGSFHPKILFLASEDSILTFISSANTTKGGILSNQDLIGSFSSPNAKEEISGEIVAIYRYLRSFSGWSVSALKDLDAMAGNFPLLLAADVSTRILTIPGQDSLLDQMQQELPKDRSLQKINIYTPFLDSRYEAVYKVSERFEVPVDVISPQKTFIAERTSKLTDDVRFFKTAGNGKSTFHAKCYEFRYDDESIVFWGSANCSYSGILSTDRNAEILVRSKLSLDDMKSLWGDDIVDPSCEVQYAKVTDDDSEPEVIRNVTLLSAVVEGELIRIALDSSEYAGHPVVVLSNAEVVSLEVKSFGSSELLVACPTHNPVIVYIEDEGEVVSNKLFLNHPERISDRIHNRDPANRENMADSSVEHSLYVAFSLFSLDRSTKARRNAMPANKGMSKRFWTLPQYNHSFGFRSVPNIKAFIEERVNRRKVELDEDSEVNEENQKKPKKRVRHHHLAGIDVAHRQSRKQWQSMQNYDHLEESESINLNRWLHGLDSINMFILKHIEMNKFPREYDKYQQLLMQMSSISTWIIKEDISDIEGVDYSIDLIRNIQDLYLVLSIYKYLSPGIRRTPRAIEAAIDIKRAVYYRYMVNCKTNEIRTSAEHREMIMHDFHKKFRFGGVAKEARQILMSGDIYLLHDLGEIKIVEVRGRSYLYGGPVQSKMSLEWVVPEEKSRIPKLADPLYIDKNPSAMKIINI